MSSGAVIIASIGTQYVPEMPFAKDHDVVEAFPPDRADEPFTISAFSGSTSLMRSGVGAILSDSEAYKFFSQLGDEDMAVAAAAGHPLDGAFKERVIARWQILPSETRSSMANDLAQGNAKGGPE